MFDVRPDEIALLSDVDLRECVGRLCEAELASQGISAVAVTWGGSQTAPDGGLDVRVDLPKGVDIDGFIPRRATGFQVKTPDMARAAILAEMRPDGTLRPVIQELVDAAGAYILVSSKGATADSALRNRRLALREGLSGLADAGRLYTDFYDRTRLATWVRCHPGLIAWVKERVGRALVGWRPYGPWCGGSETETAEYLFDDRLRVRFGTRDQGEAKSAADALDGIRDELAKPARVMRLVGLSGVGKTRLAQALFDTRVGTRPLPPSLAVYTNLGDNPDPQPTRLASDLIANRTRAVLIVDNCPSDLHRRLSEVCAAAGSQVSVLTIEYDVRDDQPEGTQVISLDTSSNELIEAMTQRHHPHLSPVDARTIAEASGGNARIALALAGTVGQSESIAGLSDEDLFQRLFRQRHAPDNSLLLAAQACSLVYSFEGEALDGDEAELPRLAELAGQNPRELYRHVSELLRRDLVQRRSVWRAMLPHAVANRLAARALEDTPLDLIDKQLVTGGTDRLARSFSRRLSYLHEQPRAVAIAKLWLAPGGLLCDIQNLNELGRAMFENIAPVVPEAALAALERAAQEGGDVHHAARRHRSTLRSLAYDPILFDRAASMLAQAASASTGERDAKELTDTFASLFTIHLSGTHASIEQRLSLIERLVRSAEPAAVALGVAALEQTLEATHFSSGHRFEFGARPRDHGYRPADQTEVRRWFAAALILLERLSQEDEALKPELHRLVVRKFRSLWAYAQVYDELEGLFHRIAAEGFWREGWAACREAMQFDASRLPEDGAARLSRLEAELKPSNLSERVRAIVLGDRSAGLDLEDVDIEEDFASSYQRPEAIARELGVAVANDEATFGELLPALVRGGNRAWPFGRGLAAASADRRATWAALAEGLRQAPADRREVSVLRGFLAEVWEKDQDLAQELLDGSLENSVLTSFTPAWHTAVCLDGRGLQRLKKVLVSGGAPVWMYRNLAFGRVTDHLEAAELATLLQVIAVQPDGFDVALEILYMRLHSDRSAQRSHAARLLQAGRDILCGCSFGTGGQRSDHRMAEVVRVCLEGSEGRPIAAALAASLRKAVAAYETYAFNNTDLLAALLAVQPSATLDALFSGPDGAVEGAAVFEHLRGHRANPADLISCEDLVSWCSQDHGDRYTLAASIITFMGTPDDSGPAWSAQAQALLARAPHPDQVLEAMVERFRPRSWSGSRASIMEVNARLLDQTAPFLSSDLGSVVAALRTKLLQDIAEERRWESERDRAQDERFE